MVAALYSNAPAPYPLLRKQFCEKFHIAPWDFDALLDMCDFHEWCKLDEMERRATAHHQEQAIKAQGRRRRPT